MKMKCITKVGLIISAVMITLGILICGAVLTVHNFNIAVFDTNTKRNAEIYTPEGEFNRAVIATSYDDIMIMPAPDGNLRVEAYEGEKDGYTVSVENGVLKIEQQDKRRWYDFVNISFSAKSYGICIYLPESVYKKLSVVTASGDIDINGISSDSLIITTASGDILAGGLSGEDIKLVTSSGDMEISNIKYAISFMKTTSGELELVSVEGSEMELYSTSGEMDIKNITADNLKMKTTSGDINAENTVILKATSVISTSGCCEFENSDSGEYEFKTVSGDIECELLTAKKFETDTTSGSVKVPFSDKDAGLFKAETTSGNIYVEYEN